MFADRGSSLFPPRPAQPDVVALQYRGKRRWPSGRKGKKGEMEEREGSGDVEEMEEMGERGRYVID